MLIVNIYQRYWLALTVLIDWLVNRRPSRPPDRPAGCWAGLGWLNWTVGWLAWQAWLIASRILMFAGDFGLDRAMVSEFNCRSLGLVEPCRRPWLGFPSGWLRARG